MIFRAICHENQSRHRQPQTNWLQHPRDQWKRQSRVFLFVVNLPSFFPLLTTFFACKGLLVTPEQFFLTPKSDIRQIMEWKFDGVDEGARRSEKSLTNGKIFSLFQAFR